MALRIFEKKREPNQSNYPREASRRRSSEQGKARHAYLPTYLTYILIHYVSYLSTTLSLCVSQVFSTSQKKQAQNPPSPLQKFERRKNEKP